MLGLNVDIGIETEGTFSGNHSFGFSNMFFLEEELSIKVTNINWPQTPIHLFCPMLPALCPKLPGLNLDGIPLIRLI